jgi:hypothetical protein
MIADEYDTMRHNANQGFKSMSATKYTNYKKSRKLILRITDAFLIILIFIEGFYIYENIVIDKNYHLYEIYSKINYDNFSFLDKNDDLFIAASKYIDCRNAKENTAKRVDILYDRIFFIEAAVYLDVEIGEWNQNGCVKQVMVRKVP